MAYVRGPFHSSHQNKSIDRNALKLPILLNCVSCRSIDHGPALRALKNVHSFQIAKTIFIVYISCSILLSFSILVRFLFTVDIALKVFNIIIYCSLFFLIPISALGKIESFSGNPIRNRSRLNDKAFRGARSSCKTVEI